MKKFLALMALTVLTACDYAERADLRKERADSLYKSAMEDYRSGRTDAAIEGFRKAVGRDPANASARFQLACLLQDAKADYIGAFCGYREFLLQHPESDKAKLAKERLEKCELELAKFLAEKHGLADKAVFAKENAALKADLRAAEMRMATAEKAADVLRTRVSALGAERDRLLVIVKGGIGGEEATVAKPPSIKEAKDLLDEEEDADRIKMSSDVAALKMEAEEELSSGSDILPARKATTNVVKTVGQTKVPAVAARQIPETYVVQEGDTLYGISKRFYGRLSAWKRIRDMNKALIPMDNRLNAGTTLRLPRP